MLPDERKQSMQEATAHKPKFGPLLVLLGGVLVMVSGFTDWGKVSPPANQAPPVTVKGSGIVLVVGIVLALLGIGLWAVRSRGAHIGLGVVAIIAGLLATLITGVAVGSKDVLISTAADKYAEGSRATPSQIEKILKDLDKRGQLDVSVKIGLWLGLAGGILVLIGGIGGVKSARKIPKAPPAPGMPVQGDATDRPAGGPLGSPPPPPGEPGPPPPEAGGTGPGPTSPLPPADPPKPGEPGSTPGFQG
jgi:hypothetical protein